MFGCLRQHREWRTDDCEMFNEWNKVKFFLGNDEYSESPNPGTHPGSKKGQASRKPREWAPRHADGSLFELQKWEMCPTSCPALRQKYSLIVARSMKTNFRVFGFGFYGSIKTFVMLQSVCFFHFFFTAINF